MHRLAIPGQIVIPLPGAMRDQISVSAAQSLFFDGRPLGFDLGGG